MKTVLEKLHKSYLQQFNRVPKFVAKAPGRVNLIGEHTDYNEGFVFPMAIDKAIWVAFTPNNTSRINVVASNFDNKCYTIDLQMLEHDNSQWREYVKGMAYELQKYYGCDLKGFDAVIYSEVPIGAGLSSSAALELSIARALVQSNKLRWEPVAMAEAAKRAENDWVGVNCGIMDQLISAVGEKDHAVLIDCRDLSYESYPLPKDIAVVILDTSTRRGLVASAYNERREQCQKAADMLGIKSLRDAEIKDIRQLIDDDKVYRRAKHVVSETKRTTAAKECMLSNNASSLGELFKQSHTSLAEDFEVTNDALDTIVELANAHQYCYGARMTGAGFGGCAVAIVNKAYAHEFCEEIEDAYNTATGLKADIHVVEAEDGVSLIVLDQ